MPEKITPSGTVHWIGTGLSTGAGLRLLIDHAPRVRLWARTEDKAAACLARLDRSGRATTGVWNAATFGDELRPGDVVVSMLPASEHPALLRQCVERRAHFACSSYLSAPIQAEVPAAEAAGTVVLVEAGLDPGIDHLFADVLISEARAAIGDAPATVEFTSHCGGIPAVANDFRYRFSWAPRGVLTALNASARYLRDGAETVVQQPWEATRPYVLDGEEFELYPNRDSLIYIEQYRVPKSWQLQTFERGTLRLSGWRQAWSEVFEVVKTGDAERIGALADELARKYPTTDADRDRVVLTVALTVRHEGGTWSGEYRLDEIGDEADSAMARCVSTPLAVAIFDILAGRVPAGLSQAAEDPGTARRWLGDLAANGIPTRLTVHEETANPQEAHA